jgi:hypothetical protein
LCSDFEVASVVIVVLGLPNGLHNDSQLSKISKAQFKLSSFIFEFMIFKEFNFYVVQHISLSSEFFSSQNAEN